MARVVSVSKSRHHTFSKQRVECIQLIAGEGVEGDAHRGETVKHRSRVKQNPDQPNLRQVHLIHGELLQWLSELGFQVPPAALGENITTQGLDLLALPKDTVLHFSRGAEVCLTGLRNPCSQIENYQKGLLSAVLERSSSGELIRKAGVMGVVKTGGLVYPGDPIAIHWPPQPFQKLERV